MMMKLKETILKKKEEEKQNLYHRKVTLEEMLTKPCSWKQRIGRASGIPGEADAAGNFPDAPYYEVSITELEKLGEKEIPKEDRRLWLFGIRNILEELGDGKERSDPFPELRRASGLPLKLKSREELKELPDLLKKFCSLTESLLGISVTVGVGSPAAEFYAIPSSYNKAMLALQNKFVFGTSRVISYEERKTEIRRLILPLGAERAASGISEKK